MCIFSTEKWSIKYGSYCIVATAQMKFASEARPSQYISPFGNTEPTCMPLSGHFMDIEGRVLVYRGWSGGAKVLGKLAVPGRPTSLDDSRARAYCACSRCGWGFVWIFFLPSIFSLFFLPLFGRRPDID